MKKAKRSLLAIVLAAVVMISALAGMAVVNVCAEKETEPELRIVSQNVSYSSEVYLLYGVSFSGFDSSKYPIKMLFWKSAQTDWTKGSESYVKDIAGTYESSGKERKVFYSDGIAAKEMTDDVYCRAYVEIDEEIYYSNIKRYSVIEYVYDRMASGNTDANQSALYSAMLNYGSAAQVNFGYSTERLANAEYKRIKVSGGSLDGYFTKGVYLTGDTVSLTADATNINGKPFLCWKDSSGNKVSDAAAFNITVGDFDEEYIAVYDTASKGLEYDSNGNDTCCIIGVGTCTDTELVIPETSPDGDSVIEIDSNVFKDQRFTSVSFPSTMETIGRNAFSGCNSITDVYYDGTEAEWLANVEIKSGNDAIGKATLHFKEEAKFTVLFKDWDGTVLKSESVAKGGSATPPTAPARDGYTFKGWDGSYTEINSNTTLNAVYEAAVKEPTIMVHNAEGSAGGYVDIDVEIVNNPGILGMTLQLGFDDSVMSLTDIKKGTALSELTFTSPKPSAFENGCSLPWDGEEVLPEDVTNGTMLTLRFMIKGDCPNGTYEVSLSHQTNIIDNDMKPLNIAFISGQILVK